MASKVNSVAAAVALCLGASATHAADFGDIFVLRGFTTAGLVYSDEDQADFVTSQLLQPKGAGYSDSVSAQVDSRTALQLTANFTDRFGAVVQVISENLYNNSWDGEKNSSFKPSLEWANVSYRVTDDFNVRGGRVVMPFFMVAEYRKVGYQSHWLRAPVEIYGQVPFSALDGVDLTYRSNIGSALNTTRVYYGGNAIRTATYKAQARSFGFHDQVEIGALSLRAAYMNVRFEAPGNGIGDMLDPFIAATSSLPDGMGAAAAAHARNMNASFNMSNEQKLNMYDIGFSYDPGAWLLMAEVFHQRSDGFMRKDLAGYVSGGVRVGSLTPYVTFAKAKHTRDYDEGIPLAGLPGDLAGFGGMINDVVLSFANYDTSQQTISAGARWDFARNFALKAQYDHVQLGDDAQGLLANIQPGFKLGGSLNVLSVAVDFMF